MRPVAASTCSPAGNPLCALYVSAPPSGSVAAGGVKLKGCPATALCAGNATDQVGAEFACTLMTNDNLDSSPATFTALSTTSNVPSAGGVPNNWRGRLNESQLGNVSGEYVSGRCSASTAAGAINVHGVPMPAVFGGTASHEMGPSATSSVKLFSMNLPPASVARATTV